MGIHVNLQYIYIYMFPYKYICIYMYPQRSRVLVEKLHSNPIALEM